MESLGREIRRMSMPVELIKERYDVLVVGSGLRWGHRGFPYGTGGSERLRAGTGKGVSARRVPRYPGGSTERCRPVCRPLTSDPPPAFTISSSVPTSTCLSGAGWAELRW